MKVSRVVFGFVFLFFQQVELIMKKAIIFALAVAGGLFSIDAGAQCTGTNAGGENCAPSQDVSPFDTQGDDGNNYAPLPASRTVLSDRWGAIAFGKNSDNENRIWTSESRKTGAEAGQAAIQLCTQGGGHGCKIILTYHNECAAYAIELNGEGRSTSAVFPYMEQAKQHAQSMCSSSTGHACEVIYSGCSYPERIQ